MLAARQRDGTVLFSKRDSLLKIAAFLRAGGFIGVLIDQRAGLKGELCPYFGRITRFSPLASLLARRTGCQVLSLALVTAAPGRWRARLEEVAAQPSTAQCAQAIERAISSSPSDQFWLQERWKLPLGKGRGIHTWLGHKPESPSRKPHRLLAWLPPPGKEAMFRRALCHPDATVEWVLEPSSIADPKCYPGTCHVLSWQENPEAVLRAIDAAKPLPIDFITVADKATAKQLHRPAAQLGIAVYVIDELDQTVMAV